MAGKIIKHLHTLKKVPIDFNFKITFTDNVHEFKLFTKLDYML